MRKIIIRKIKKVCQFVNDGQQESGGKVLKSPRSPRKSGRLAKASKITTRISVSSPEKDPNVKPLELARASPETGYERAAQLPQGALLRTDRAHCILGGR